MRRTNADYALNPGPLSAEEFARMVIKDWGCQTSFTISREDGKWVARHWITGELIENPYRKND